MGLFLSHPPHEYWKKSAQGSAALSIEVTSRAGSYFEEGCCALAREISDAQKSTVTQVRENAMTTPHFLFVARCSTQDSESEPATKKRPDTISFNLTTKP
jgi:hypothetical protein